MVSNKWLYEQYHAQCPFSGVFGGATFLAPLAATAYPDAARVLDFGCGAGYAVNEMRRRGKEWFGIEVSETAYEKHLSQPWFYLGSLEQFEDRCFDMVYSTEVLEHIPEEDAIKVVSEICRVTRSYIFLSISLRPSSDNNRYHCTLKPREWWEKQFTNCGFKVDRQVVRAYQRRVLGSTSKILSRWSGLGPIPRAFAENPPYELHGETQFWYFAFYREPCRRPLINSLYLAWKRQRAVPFLRWLLRMDRGPQVNGRIKPDIREATATDYQQDNNNRTGSGGVSQSSQCGA